MNELEKMSKLKKEELLKDLNSLKKGLLDYKKRQERHLTIKFTEGQKKSLDALRLRVKDKYRWLKEPISKYGGDVSIKVVGMNWDVFVYSLRSRYMDPHQFTALDKAINAVTTAIERIEAIPVASIDWRDIRVTPRPKDHGEESGYLFDNMHLHPKIIDASEALFKDGHYAQAIFEAFKAVENFVKQKTGLSLYGKQLMAQVFKEENPLIKVTEAGRFDKDVQEGFKFLFMGAMVRIRNPKAHHKVIQKDPFITLEYLGFASFLIKRIEGWEVD